MTERMSKDTDALTSPWGEVRETKFLRDEGNNGTILLKHRSHPEYFPLTRLFLRFTQGRPLPKERLALLNIQLPRKRGEELRLNHV